MRILFFLFLSMVLLGAGMLSPKQEPYSTAWLRKNLVLIPQGTLILRAKQEDKKTDTLAISSFFMFNQEVSNGFYLFYLHSLKTSGDTAAYNGALPDTLVWRPPGRLTCGESSYVEYYLRHPAYSDYPVVGVTYAQSVKFCEWLTRHYVAQLSKKGKKIAFRLPSRAEWMYAAGGKERHTVYPWGGPYLRNHKGQFLANYSAFAKEEKENPDTIMVQHGAGYMDLTAPVKSYWPNSFGLYQMAGNVSEFVLEAGLAKGGSWKDVAHDLRIDSDQPYSKHSSASNGRGFRFVMEITE